MLKKLKYSLFLILAFGGITSELFSNNSDSSLLIKKKQRTLVYSELGLGVATHSILYFEWYSNHPMGRFHFFNDGKEWQQMDKLGHLFSTYSLTVMGHQAGLMVGYDNKKAALNGLILGLAFQSTIEVLDGFSTNWGASVPDLVANTTGAFMAYLQAMKWNRQKITMKWSYTPTNYAAIRPNVLGNGIHQEFLKDYNGQTYWMSFNVADLCKIQNEFLPKWLNIELGYGASGMLGAFENKWIDNTSGTPFDYTHIQRYRRFYLSAGIDWVKLAKPKSHWEKLFFTALNCLKFPFPALEYNTLDNKIQGHYLKF